jgi:hypothetical protein
LVNDEKTTLIELNRICGVNNHLSSTNRIPKRRLSMQANEAEGIVEQVKGIEGGNRTGEVMPNFGAR